MPQVARHDRLALTAPGIRLHTLLSARTQSSLQWPSSCGSACVHCTGCSSRGGSHQIELAGDAVLLERPGDRRPHLPQILLCSRRTSVKMKFRSGAVAALGAAEATWRLHTARPRCTAVASGGGVMIVTRATQAELAQPTCTQLLCATLLAQGAEGTCDAGNVLGAVIAALLLSCCRTAPCDSPMQKHASPRYLGNSMAKELSSSRPTGLSSLEKGWMLQWSVPSTSHGFGLSCCSSTRRRCHQTVPPSHGSTNLHMLAAARDAQRCSSICSGSPSVCSCNYSALLHVPACACSVAAAAPSRASGARGRPRVGLARVHPSHCLLSGPQECGFSKDMGVWFEVCRWSGPRLQMLRDCVNLVADAAQWRIVLWYQSSQRVGGNTE
jgi:hypothetical protein